MDVAGAVGGKQVMTAFVEGVFGPLAHRLLEAVEGVGLCGGGLVCMCGVAAGTK